MRVFSIDAVVDGGDVQLADALCRDGGNLLAAREIRIERGDGRGRVVDFEIARIRETWEKLQHLKSISRCLANVFCNRFDLFVKRCFLALWQKTGQELREEYGSVNPELFMTAEKIEKLQEPEKVLCPSETGEILQFLFLLPQGIQEMNGKVPGIVLTSINVGELYLDTKKGRFATVAEVRSAIASQRDAVAEKVKLLGRRFGMETGISCVYPGWRDNPDSPLTALLQERYQALFGRPLEATPVHVGLECGFFLAKRPELDCISIGPDAGNLHSPQEYVSIASTRRMYRFLRELLSFRN